MAQKLDKKHWYDGWIYSKFIDSQNIPFRYKIFDFMDSNCTVLDVGCGTGGFTMDIAKHCKKVVGIDVSYKQIEQAKKLLNSSKSTNIEFRHINASKISEEFEEKFDYAVFTFMIHEISQNERLSVLNEISKVVKSVIILEYNVPHPYNGWGILTRAIEFFAGKDHFTNFLDFKKRGGINKILEETGFHISEEKINRKNIFKIVIANKTNKSN